ncbi:MAG: hypothetical protein ABIL68_05415 [bacterium]
MFFRFLLTCTVAYFGYRFVKGLWDKGSQKEEVKGKQRSKPLDLRKEDVDDARFEDIENK